MTVIYDKIAGDCYEILVRFSYLRTPIATVRIRGELTGHQEGSSRIFGNVLGQANTSHTKHDY